MGTVFGPCGFPPEHRQSTAQLGSRRLCAVPKYQTSEVNGQCETGRHEDRKKGPRSSIQNFRDAEFDYTKDVFLQVIALHVTRYTKSSNFLIPVVVLPLEVD